MNLKLSFLLVAIAIPSLAGVAQAAKPEDLEKLTNGNQQCNECDLSQADLSGMDLSGFKLEGANLNGANLVKTNLSGADLTKASIVGANLAEADLSNSTLTETTFVYSNLAGVKIQGARIRNADFRGANLAEVDLSKSQIRHSTFAGANIYQVIMPRVQRKIVGSNANAPLLDGENQAPQDMTIGPTDSNMESGTTYHRPPRKFKVPAYIRTVQRSSVAGAKFHKDSSSWPE